MQDPILTFSFFFRKTICTQPVASLLGEVSAFGRLLDLPETPTARELAEKIQPSEYSPSTWRKITRLHSDAESNPQSLSILTRMEQLRQVTPFSLPATSQLQATCEVQAPSQAEVWVETVLTSMIAITAEKLWRPYANQRLTRAQLERQFFENEYAKDIEIWMQQEGGDELAKLAYRHFRRNENDVHHEQLVLRHYFDVASCLSPLTLSSTLAHPLLLAVWR